MSSNEGKTREQILAERQERKKKKAALKSQPKDKEKSSKNIDEIKNPQSLIASADKHEKSDHMKTCNDKAIEFNNCNQQKQQHSIINSNANNPAHKNESEVIESQTCKDSINNKFISCENITTPKECSKQLENKLSNELPKVESSKKDKEKSKSVLKAERRAKQEAERAKKLEKSSVSSKEKKVVTQQPIISDSHLKVNTKATSEVSHKVKLFAHLYDITSDADVVDNSENVHPSIIKLKTQISSRVVSGANACCLSLLNALKKVVMDFETPSNQEFSRGLQNEITKSMSYLGNQRQLAVSMVNAVKQLKFKINQCKGNELECKNTISDWIDTYIKEQMEMAAQAISLFVEEKITVGDVILTYGWSPLIYQLLKSASHNGLKFKVIVADGRPWLEGRELLKKLVEANIDCDYVFVNGLSYVMPKVTKILLGAHCLLANGYVMSRIGSSQIALLAKTFNVPVLVCCETHKFSERVQTDSFVYNELGNPDDLASNKGCISKELHKWRSIPSLTPLNLMYDVTPPDLVSAVVTEIAVLPCTSVPVILRIKPPDHSF